MKRYSQHQIEALLNKFMDGQTTVEEEALLADYFRSHDVPAEWEDYRDMFSYFDRGMEGNLVPEQQSQASLTTLMGRRWWGIAAAACMTAAIMGTAVLHRPTSTSQTEIAEVTSTEQQEPSTQPRETQDFASLQKTEQVPSKAPVETQNLAQVEGHESSLSMAERSQDSPNLASHKTARRLKAENKRLAEENERLRLELEDLKRRAFIIDLEAMGFKAVKNEDGTIVFIDLEQELENELNNQPTTNIPAL